MARLPHFLPHFCGLLVAVGFSVEASAAQAAAEATSGMQTSDWVSLASGFGGTILGAIIASHYADRATKRAEVKTLERDAAARLDADKTVTIRMMVKLQLLTNAICSLQKHVADGYALADASREAIPPCIAVKPTVGLTNRFPGFDLQEFSGLLAARRVDLISELLLLSQRWDSSETSMARYSCQSASKKATALNPG